MRDGDPSSLPTMDPPGSRTHAGEIERMFVCYVPGFDLRRIEPGTTPFVSERISRGPTVRIRTLPNTELLPTMVTGVYPDEHGVWQVRLRKGAGDATATSRLDHLPDLESTSWQCLRQYLDPGFDLATVPARRRRRFELHRFKYTRRQNDDQPLRAFGDVPSIFG
ncbi:MAG: hypothetical protein QUU85_02100, partial [Candidatus Eisenbacteria bacterium]|nr:hypothetical protein [Candidatus Eisenbacteria bacterium]